MKRKELQILSAILFLFTVSLYAGTGGRVVLDPALPAIRLTSQQAGEYVRSREAAVPNIRPGNASELLYADEATKGQTDYSLLYLHGFSASPEEGNPVHVNLAHAFGMNVYIPRLAGHGLITDDPLLDMTPESLWNSAKEALVVARALGKKVIVMGTSTGGTLALQLAADYPDLIAGLILFSPNVRIANKASWLLARPLGLQIGRMVVGGKYRKLEPDPKTDPYWYNTYRVEALVYLQELVEKTMKPAVFKKVKQPAFLGYYYRDKDHQDPTVSVKAELWMFGKLGTPVPEKESVAFPDAGAHVIGCDLTNPNWKEVYQASYQFLENKMHLKPVGNK